MSDFEFISDHFYESDILDKGGGEQREQGGGPESYEHIECGDQECPIISDTLLRDVKRALFYKGTAYSPIENREVFQTVMSLLSSYELASVDRRASQKQKPTYLYQRLKEKIKACGTMDKDFIFYFVLVLRFQHPLFTDIYQSSGDMKEGLQTFIKFVIKSFKKLVPEGVAKVFESFIQRGTFNAKTTQPFTVPEPFDFDVFSLFLQSCQVLFEKVDDIRSNIIILSMYMVTVHALGSHMPKPSQVWKKYLIESIHENTLDEKIIEEIRKGREQAVLFKVPRELAFDEQLMTIVFLGDDCETLQFHSFKLLKCFLKAVQPTCDDLIIFIRDVLNPIRVRYKFLLECYEDKEERVKMLTHVSDHSSTPELTTVEEGLEVVEQIVHLHEEKRCKRKELVVEEAVEEFNEEIRKWFQLLLSVINFEEKTASGCCKLFFNVQLRCCIDHREFIAQQLVNEIEKKYSLLSAASFVPLFEGLHIWQKENVAAYLADYAVDTFGLDLMKCRWKVLLKSIVERFPETEAHDFLLGFLKSVADWYSEQRRPRDFFKDLLILEVPKLFFIDNHTNNLMDSFHTSLEKYYDRFQTQCVFTEITDSIMECVPKQRRNYFQDTVLQVVAKGIVEEILDFKAPEDSMCIITGNINISCRKCDDSSMQIFCWRVVGDLSGRLLHLFSNHSFPKKYRSICLLIGSLYKKHCEIANPQSKQNLVDEDCSIEIPENVSPQIKAYFEWVQCMQKFILRWSNRLTEENFTLKDILLHTCQYKDIHCVMTVLGFDNMVIGEQELEKLTEKFHDKRNKVSSILIQTDIERSKTLWCYLPSVLQRYGLSLPDDVLRNIEHYVVYPQEREGIHHREHDGYFSITLRQDTTLRDLNLLCERLETFLKEFKEDSLKFFVFFYVHQSSLFEKYLTYNIKKCIGSMPIQGDCQQCEVTVKIFSEAIISTKGLICRLIQGEAEYREIVADGAVVLKDIDTKFEISVLDESIEKLRLSVSGKSGLLGVKSMIELLKASSHITLLRDIFQRYNLMLCNNDQDFKELSEIVLHINEQITPNGAIEYLKIVKTKLSIPDKKSVDCLEFLNEVFKSKEFYEFLVHRRFYGKQGHKAFRQQYELITAQLQNKASDFEEKILNHLLPAFQFLSPFIAKYDDSIERTQPSFKDLVSEMWKLDTEFGPKKLRNVYQNFHLVFQWFSEVQGNTAKNIETELEDVMRTGTFRLKADAPLELEFQRSAGVSMSESKPSQHIYLWHTNEVNEFVTRLGFLSKGEKTRAFICLNEVAHKVLDMISKIKHFEPNISLEISCAKTLEEAKSQLQCLQEKLKKGRAIVTEVQMKYRWLYYFPGSTVSALHQVILDKDFNKTIELVLPFPPLIGNTDQHREGCAEIRKRVGETLVRYCNEEKSTVKKVAFPTPMGEFVGQFLHEVLPRKLPEIPPNQPQQHHVLHYTPGYAQDYLIKFLLKIYERKFPQRCEVFWCDETSTEDELEYFFNRIEGVTSIYTLLETNNLPIMLQECVLQRIIDFQKNMRTSVIHCVDTEPSLLHETFDIVEYNVCEPGITKEQVSEVFEHQESIKCSSTELVCGIPGDGKSYYILNKLEETCSSYKTIPINEGFSRRQVIKSLCSLPLYSDMSDSVTKVYGIFFNFTMYFTEETLHDTENQKMLKKIGWFLFELLVLGKVDDFQSASSFQLHSTANWHFFIEVPPLTSTSINTSKEVEETILTFREQFPVFKYIGRTVMIGFRNQLSINHEVQLVCKYFKACHETSFHRKKGKSIKPHETRDLPPYECVELLHDHIPRCASRMISRKLFIRYMYRRCQFLEKLQKTKGGAVFDVCSTLFDFILDEATAFVSPQSKEAWCQSIPYQLIYKVQQDGEIKFSLLTSNPSLIKLEHKRGFEKIGVVVPTETELQSRKYLVHCLSTNLKIPEELCDEILTKEKYVVTLDFILKMLNIHERRQCGIPVVIEGETGVGKSALIEILSKLWNISYITYVTWIEGEKQAFQLFLEEKLKEYSTVSPPSYKEALERIKDGYQQEHIAVIAELPLQTGKFYTLIKQYFLKKRSECFWTFIEPQDPNVTFSDLLHHLEISDTSEISTLVADSFLNSRLLNLFFKIPIHAALKPKELGDRLRPILKKASEVQEKCSYVSSTMDPPIFAIFFDELNTSSCGGFLKEIIADRTFFGQAIPSNVFIIGAANPHRGDATKLLESVPELWCRTTYHVQPLHPTLRYLVWDYGALGPDQEEEYVKAKLKMVQPIYFQNEGATICDSLTDVILSSQKMMRDNVFAFLKDRMDTDGHKIDTDIVKNSSKSCVSQRDIQRVITFFCWILKVYRTFCPHGPYSENEEEYQRRAILVSLGIVYYLRQPENYRKLYVEEMERCNISQNINFSRAFNDDLDWFISKVTIPEGIRIAKTKALKENVFATTACVCTRTPVLIVGEPGSSKSLSFHLVAESLRGKESTSDIFKETDIFPSVDPYFLQCSHHTTSKDIVTVFERAKGRQKTFVNPWKRNCVVFMDEAGLPKESRESLKALHHYLDNPSVAFVGISNHVLDAAKTNRCVSVVRMKMSKDDLEYLAKGCICDNPNEIPPERSDEIKSIMKFCNSYQRAIEKQQNAFFGLRDFVHFLHYIRSNYECRNHFRELVLRGLERNFNGKSSCKQLFIDLLRDLTTDEDDAKSVYEENSRGIIDILRDSLLASLSEDNLKNAARYKLIIDPSKDNSLIRYLFKYGIVEKKNTRMFMCSDAFSDEEAQKVVIVSTICHSVTEGHTVILFQTNEINESFYDLFNLSYRYIDDPEQGRLYYANVAVGPYIKPCRVDRKFQCIVLLHEEEVSTMPAPFLNRFEKYHITYGNMVDSALRGLPYGWRSLIKAVNVKVKMFAEEITASESIFGYHEETVSSLFLWFLPAKVNLEVDDICDHSENSEQFLLEIVVQILKSVGFYIPSMTMEEMELDIKSIFGFLRLDADFDDYVRTLTDNHALNARCEALRILNGKLHNVNPISIGACFIISLTLQWIVRHLCKALMQVMIPEAVVIFDQKIPSTYIMHYLKHQQHFDLKTLINQRYQMMLNESSSGIPPTKLLVFCRTSLFVTNLTFQGASTVDDSDTRITFINKLSHHTEAWVSERLNEFYGFRRNKCVLIVKVNMQETSVKAINHIRMMIEDTENHYSNQEKLAVVLLHYPSSMSSCSSHPTLFQAGWSHHYLDSISMTQDAINIEQWISLILDFPAAAQTFIESNVSGDESPSSLSGGNKQSEKPISYFTKIVENVQRLIKLNIPSVVSLLASQIAVNASTSHQKDITSRENLFSVLLNEKGFGTLLFQKFEGYLSPALFAGFLRQAASLIVRRESSSRMSVIIQNLLCVKFSEFMLYMVSVINETGSFHVVLDSDCPLEVITLIKVVVTNLDLPEFSNLSHLSIIKRRANVLRRTRCHFPFYNLISNSLDDIIAECKCEAKEMSSTEENFLFPTEEDVTLLVEAKLLEIYQMKCNRHNGKIIAATLKLMEEHSGLLDGYLCDFMSDKCTVVCVRGGVVFNYLKKYLLSGRENTSSTQNSSLPYPVKCLITSHIYFHYHRNELTQILPIVKQLNELQLLAKEMDGLLIHLEYHTSDEIPLLGDTKSLCAYIIDLLLCFTHSVWLKDTYSLHWYSFYHNMINNQYVKKLLYKNMEPYIEAKMNIIHTAYVILHCASTDRVFNDCARSTFWSLYNKLIKQKHEDAQCWPRLEHCVSIILEMLPHAISEAKINSIVNSLLEHFFSEEKFKYHPNDVMWLIQLSNGSVVQKRIRILTDSIEHGLPFGVVKHYLTRVLIHDKNPKGKDITVMNFSEEYRHAIGEELQKATVDDTHYSPYFYVDKPPSCPSLAHLYFTIVLEAHMDNSSLTHANIQYEVLQLHNQRSDKTCNMKLLLSIEQQALIQTLLKRVAEHQAEKRRGKAESTERLLCDVSSSDMMNHGIVVAMHLLNCTRNRSKLTEYIDNLYSNGMRCLEYITTALHKPPRVTFQRSNLLSLEVYKHLLPFYDTVCKEMMTFYQREDCYDVGNLLNLHRLWSKSPRLKELHIESKNCLVMMMWLAAYHNFFVKKKYFEPFISALREWKFMHPKQLKLFEIILAREVQFSTNAFFEELFRTSLQDETKIEMRTCIINIIAAIFGSPNSSTHLWYNLMEPEQLDGTFLTGFMYLHEVSSEENSFYEDGTHLTLNGMYGKYAYMADGGERRLTLPSLYVLLWMNFATFGMAEFIEVSERKCKYVCKDPHNTLKTCSERLQSIWRHMTINLDFCDEHVSYLITHCLSGIMKASCDGITQGGVLRKYTDLKMYESMWQKYIFDPAYSHVSKKVLEEISSTTVFKDIDDMKRRFPKSPSLDDLSYIVQTKMLHKEEFQLLSQFIVEYHRLYLGTCLLPDLVRLYQWLHQEMAHSVTMETASKISLANIREQLEKNTSEEYFDLYNHILEKFSKFISLTGRHKGVPKERRQSHITKNTVLRDLVSGVPSGKDCIYRVITDIVSSHRSMLMCASNAMKWHRDMEVPSVELHPSLVSPNDCIIDVESEGSKITMLLRKWTCFWHAFPETCLPGKDHQYLDFNVKELQEDVAEFYLAAKPMIQNAETMYTWFSFVQPARTIIYQELAQVKHQLPLLFHESLQKYEKKILEKEFHSATSQDYQSLITVFSISVHILVSEVKQATDTQELAEKPLHIFLCSEENEEKTFWDTQTEQCRLSKSQIAYVKSVKLKNLFSILEIFMKWRDDGVYDFHMLPYGVKGPIATKEEEEIILSIKEKYDNIEEFSRDLRKLESALVDVQLKILKASHQVSIKSLLDTKTPLTDCIPESICIHHYVSLRLIIRRLIMECQNALPDIQESKTWEEYEPEPWKTILNCDMQTTAVDSQCYPSQERFGFAIRAEGEENLKERFKFLLECANVDRPMPHKEYMSESKTMEDSPPRFSDLVMSITAGKKTIDFDTDEVCKFLRVTGLSECIEWAENEGITGKDLMEIISQEELRSLKDSFYRLKLLVNLQCLQNECQRTKMAQQYPPKKIAQFLGYIGEKYEKYIQLFLDNEVDGEILDQANDEALKDLGIPSAIDRALIKHKFSKLKEEPSLALPAETVHEVLVEFGLREVATFVEMHGIDSEVFAKASDDLKTEMNIKPADYRKIKRKLSSMEQDSNTK